MILSTLLLPFMIRAILAGVLVALLTSTIGVFALLRKASFYGDAISHSALTGIALGLLLGINPNLMALMFTSVLSVLIPLLENKSKLHIDSILGFLLPFNMALGVILLSLIPGYKPDLMSYLFGNILTASPANLLFILSIIVITTFILVLNFSKLVAVALDSTYAKITGINVLLFTILHHFLLALAIIPSINLVGIILVNALLIIPAAIARQVSHSLKTMFILAPLIAVISTLLGIITSVLFNLPTGPIIVIILGLIFLSTTLFVKKS